jgi:hypothetical protein
MIWHFLKRDIKDYQFYWAMVFLLVTVFLIFFWKTSMILYLYLATYACFFLAFLPANYLTGVTWRAQHIMSRNYLLALPVPRKQMFHLILIRILVFWIPLLLFILYIPFELNQNIPYTLHHYGEYVLLIITGAFWLINTTIGMQLRFENITRYMHQKQRIWAWIQMLTRAILESGIMVLAVITLYAYRTFHIWSALVLAWIVTYIRYRSNLRKWV